LSSRSAWIDLAKFLANDPAQRPLEWFGFSLGVLQQRCFDHGLIVSATGTINLLFEPIENGLIDTDSDSVLSPK